MQQEEAVVGEQLAHGLHEGAVVLEAHVLEHSDRDDAVEGVVYLAIVLQPYVHGQITLVLVRVVDLLLRDGYADHLAAVVFGHVAGRAAPAAADVQHAHPRLESQLARAEVDLCFLGLVERFGVLPVAAAVGESRVEHALVEVVSDIVVALADGERSPRALQIDEFGADHVERKNTGDHLSFEPGLQDPGQHLIDSLAVPPPVHVGLTEAEGGFGEDPSVKALIMHLYIPGAIPLMRMSVPSSNRSILRRYRFFVPGLQPSGGLCSSHS